MPRQKDPAGDLIAAKVMAAAAGAGVQAGTPITAGQLQAVWRAVADGLFVHDAANAEVSPGTFTVSVPSFGTHNVTGIGKPLN